MKSTIRAGKVETEIVTYPARTMWDEKFPEIKSEQFVLSDEIKTKFLRKVYAEANKTEGKDHNWHSDGYCLKCTHSSIPVGGLTDYNDSFECDASYSWEDKIFIEANNKKFNVEEMSGKWTAYRDSTND